MKTTSTCFLCKRYQQSLFAGMKKFSLLAACCVVHARERKTLENQFPMLAGSDNNNRENEGAKKAVIKSESFFGNQAQAWRALMISKSGN